MLIVGKYGISYFQLLLCIKILDNGPAGPKYVLEVQYTVGISQPHSTYYFL